MTYSDRDANGCDRKETVAEHVLRSLPSRSLGLRVSSWVLDRVIAAQELP